MNEIGITYDNLFTILRSLGFQEKRSRDGAKQRHVFFHERTDTILAYGRDAADPVTPADVLSTEVHLRGRGISKQPLEFLLPAMPVTET